MGVYIAFVLICVPGIPFLIWCMTPSGKAWMRRNDML